MATASTPPARRELSARTLRCAPGFRTGVGRAHPVYARSCDMIAPAPGAVKYYGAKRPDALKAMRINTAPNDSLATPQTATGPPPDQLDTDPNRQFPPRPIAPHRRRPTPATYDDTGQPAATTVGAGGQYMDDRDAADRAALGDLPFPSFLRSAARPS